LLTDEEFKRFLKALGTRIKTLRKDKNFNMRDIMIATGYYDTQWRKYEAGGSMNLQSLMKVAMALDVSLAELFDGLAQWPKRSVAEIEGLEAFKAGKSRPKADAASPQPSDLSSSDDPKAAKRSPSAKRATPSTSRVSTATAAPPRKRTSK
jgi:transcriptional regulator with XRE-family HTH domain